MPTGVRLAICTIPATVAIKLRSDDGRSRSASAGGARRQSKRHSARDSRRSSDRESNSKRYSEQELSLAVPNGTGDGSFDRLREISSEDSGTLKQPLLDAADRIDGCAGSFQLSGTNFHV